MNDYKQMIVRYLSLLMLSRQSQSYSEHSIYFAKLCTLKIQKFLKFGDIL